MLFFLFIFLELGMWVGEGGEFIVMDDFLFFLGGWDFFIVSGKRLGMKF